MRLNSLLTLSSVVGTMILVGCGGGGGGSTTPDATSPVFTTNDSISMPENQINVMTVHATDTSTVTYSISAGDDRSLFSINSLSGALTFNTAPDFENPTDVGSNNIYEVTVTATDTSTNRAQQMISVTVTDVDEAPPVFTSNDAYTSPENKRYITSDINAQSASDITYSITAGEDDSKFAIDSYDGTLMFKASPDYDIPGDTDKDNIYQATITATDTQSKDASQDITVTLSDIDESIPKSYQVVSNLPNGTTTLDLGNSSKDVYLLFTNTDKENSSTPTVSHNKYVSTQSQKVYISQSEILSGPNILHAPDYVQEFNSNSRAYLTKTDTSKQFKVLEPIDKNQDIVGEEKSFCVNINSNNNCIQWTTATSKKVISNIVTKQGIKTLNVWVSNNSFDGSCTKSQCVTQDMVDELANTFLHTGLNNDIYDWVTNIYEEEWGSDAQAKYSNLIGADNEITILLTDINEDNIATGGVVGFFWSKDNFDKTDVGGSNERVMFYIDSVMFANGDNGWDIDDYWPKELISTLAHEFQHMIHYYQKTILLANANTNTWINEMLSESTEDLVATKIKHIGPRGVDYIDGSAGPEGNTKGRYPYFNANNTLSLTLWSGVLADYSKVNAFGAYLLRNYGGEKILHDIMHNDEIDEQAVMDALQGMGKTFDELIHEWGISVLLSDHTDAQRDQYSYNTNDFSASLKDQTIYKMGSINFFNYYPEPTIETSMNAIAPQGNYYYEVVTDQTGDFDVTITKDPNVIVSAVIKE